MRTVLSILLLVLHTLHKQKKTHEYLWSRFKERFKMNEEYIQWKKARFWCKPKHSCKSQLFWKRWLWRPKGHQLPKSICFLNCVFLPCYFQYTYPTCPWAVQGSLEAAHTLPNGFPFVETRLTTEKKNSSNRYGKGLLLSGWLCDISGDNHNKRQITARFTVSDKLAPRTPSHFPKNLCLQTRRDHATVWRQRARATRH